MVLKSLSCMHKEAPPDDFRQISVFPTSDDIHEKNPFVRTNLTNSAYLKFAMSYCEINFSFETCLFVAVLIITLMFNFDF